VPDPGEVRCPVCASPSEIVLLRRGVPVHQNLVFESRDDARGIARGDLSLACCERCGFAFNSAFDESKLAYGRGYDNTQSCSPTFLDHMRGLAEELVANPALAAGHVVEVGCGAGAFLRMLADLAPPGFTGEGFDPAYRGPESELDGRLGFVRSFFGPETESRPAAAVISRHVIEHIPDPVPFLEAVRSAAIRGEDPAEIYLETPSVEWIFGHGAIWDLFYEHCSYFSPGSISEACARAGIAAESVRPVFGGQYLWVKARPGIATTSELQAETLELARAFAERMARIEEHLRGLLRGAPSAGSTFLWGAGAKGVTVANLIDPGCASLAGVVDVNPRKQGGWLPGTGHPIVGPEALAHAPGGRVIVMNSNYLDEIRSTIRSIGVSLDVTTLEQVV
jgi:SAM-dependent methyltransferase